MLSNLERPKTLKETALNQLREAITLGHFSPGERLVERVLCEQLGVSRTVIRECIRHLESDQLVIASPNIGPTVATLNINQVKEIYEIRSMLEVSAVRSCALIANETIVAELENYCASITAGLAEGKIKEVLADTRLFYQIIFTAGGKTVAWDLVERLNGRIGQLRAMTLSSAGRSVTGPKNLLAIVTAIKAHDAETAAQACADHLEQAKQIALNELDS
ncbi:MAG: GntR family transcriptional regulator [Cocleimonas sp.]